jgi:hypothetical protein
VNEEEPDQNSRIYKTPISFAFLSESGKWMFTSAGKSVRLLKPQIVQAMANLRGLLFYAQRHDAGATVRTTCIALPQFT